MKKQILMLIIGILIGAVISTGVFLVLKRDDEKQMNKMDRGERPTTMDGNFINNGDKMRGRPDDNNDEKQDTTDSNEANS